MRQRCLSLCGGAPLRRNDEVSRMLLEDRKAQLFPTLTPRQRAFAIRFASGAARRFEAGEKVFDVGDRNAGVWLIAEGGIIATRRDGLGREQLFTTCGPGQFSGEISELGGQASLAAARAAPEGCVAYPFDALHLRALVIGSAEIGEFMMRALFSVAPPCWREEAWDRSSLARPVRPTQ